MRRVAAPGAVVIALCGALAAAAPQDPPAEDPLTGLARIAADYEAGRGGDEPAARRAALAALEALVRTDPPAREAPAALRVMERFAGLPDERAGAPARFRTLRTILRDPGLVVACVGAEVRACLALERFADAKACLDVPALAARPADRAGLARVVARAERRAALQPGKLPPTFSATALDGTERSPGTWRGRVVLVHAWSRTDRASVVTLEPIRALHAVYGPQGFECLGLALDDNLDALRKFCADWKVTWPQVCDGKGAEGPVAEAWVVDEVPTSWLLDRRGRVRHVNLSGGDALKKAVEALVAEPVPPPDPPAAKAGG